jgi:hypothetical protein
MTLQEILKAKGMSDEDIESTIGEMKQNKIFTTSHENMDVRYPKLKADHDDLTSRHGEATKLIEGFKTDAKNNEALQGKITSYEATIADLTKQNEELKIENAMDRKLTAAGAKPEDFDYLKFQWKKKGDISLDDNGDIKGGDDAIAGLKTQHPVHFASAVDQRELQPHQLHDRKQDEGGMTKAEFLRKPYAERVAFANENPDAYKSIMNH